MATIKKLAIIILLTGLCLAQELPIDAITDLGQPVPGVINIWTITTAGLDGKIYGGTSDGYPRSHMFIYDPATQEFTDLGIAGLEIYCITTGKDSLIYGGSYKTPGIGGHFFTYDPQKSWDPGNTPLNNPYDMGPAIPNPSYPSEAIIYAVSAGKDGKIYGGTGYAMDVARDYAHLFKYDPVTKQTTDLAFFAGEVGIITLAVGTDGKVYGSLTPSGKLFVYDPLTGNVTQLGIPLPGNTIHDLATGTDGRIYCGTMLDGHLISYDPETGSFTDIGQVVDYPGAWSITSGNNGRIYIGGANGHFVSYDPRLPWNPGTTPDNNPRDYGVAISGENRIRCLTVGTDNLIYGGTASHAHLFVFVPRPIFIGRFMTPEHISTPFDLIISDGITKKNWYSVTNVITEVPDTATYTYIYPWDSYHLVTRTQISISPGKCREIEFYAINPRTVEERTKVYIGAMEKGANTEVYSEYDPSMEQLKWRAIQEPNKVSELTIFVDTNTLQSPQYVIEECKARKQNAVICLVLGWEWHFDAHEGEGETYFARVDNNNTLLGIANAIYNDNRIDTFALRFKTSLKDLIENEYPMQYFYPQYALPPGLYFLRPNGLPYPFLETWLPVEITSTSPKSLLLEYHPPQINELLPFTFGFIAYYYFTNPQYTNLQFIPEEQTLTLEVNRNSNYPYPYFAYFVLPDTLFISELFSASSDSSKFGINQDYTLASISGYNLITIRLNKDTTSLSLKYGTKAYGVLQPAVLNLGSQGKWVTAYIELPSGYDVNDINVSTLRLEFRRQFVNAETHPTRIGDWDSDGIPDLMVKFDRQKVIDMLSDIEAPADLELLITGSFNNLKKLATTCLIKVISPGGGPQTFQTLTNSETPTPFVRVIPNPVFTGGTAGNHIEYGIPKACKVQLVIYDITGRKVCSLWNGVKQAGCHSIRLDNLKELSRGVYFLRLSSQDFSSIGKFVIR